MPEDKNERLRALGGLLKRLPELVDRGVALLIRVSSEQQLKNYGSIEWQRDQLAFLLNLYPDLENVRVFEGAESAQGNKFRPVFETLLRHIRAHQVGVVVVADVDRNARNEADSTQLYDTLKEHGGIVLERGQPYDPGDPSHRMILRIRSAVAEYDNDNRTLRFMTARATLARSMRLAIPLPTGLIWADPTTPAFKKAAEDAGLAAWISADALKQNRTAVDRGENKLRVLPYPDAEVHAACSLVLQWLIETRDLNSVMQRIAGDSAWPRPGEFPTLRQSVVRLDNADQEIPPVTWKRVVDRTDGREELGRARIFNWLQSPALYGIYAHDVPSVAKLLPNSAHAKVWEPTAFPSFQTSSQYSRVLSIIQTKRRFDRVGEAEGPRCHALPLVRCSEPLPGGDVCSRTLSVIYPSEGTEYAKYGHFYKTGACDARGHGYKLPMAVDKVIVDAVLDLFTDKKIRDQLTLIEKREGAGAEMEKRASTRVTDLKDKLDWAEERAYHAKKSGRPDRESHWLEKHDTLLKRIREAEDELRRAHVSRGEEDEISSAEYNEIIRLASDLPQVLERARNHDNLVAEVMSEIIACVHARKVGWATYLLEIEFHDGQRIPRIVWSRPTAASQPLVLLARERLGEWADPINRGSIEANRQAQEIAGKTAKEINCLLGAERNYKWTANRLFSAILSNPATPVDLTDLQSVKEFAETHDVQTADVTAKLLAGKLGEAELRGGMFWIRPDPADLHAAFPEVARKDVAKSLNANPADVYLVTDLAKRFGKRSDTLWHILENNDMPLANDAAGRSYSTLSACQQIRT